VETAFGTWRGHTFHYSLLDTDHAVQTHARKHPAGAQGEAFHVCGSLTASYFHAWFPSCIEATAAVFSGRTLFGECS
jgi:cobyrinic acid a,c-diamide synthase